MATTRQPSDTESLPTNCFVHNIESPSPTNIRCTLYHVYDHYTQNVRVIIQVLLELLLFKDWGIQSVIMNISCVYLVIDIVYDLV